MRSDRRGDPGLLVTAANRQGAAECADELGGVMREKIVKRYYCDFCKKAGLSKYHMARHELHCTLNPKRDCRMCNFISGVSADAAELSKSLPPFPHDFQFGTDPAYVQWLAEMPAALIKLREETDNCPACIMAALRQANIPVPAVEGFDFKTESKSIFDEANEERMAAYGSYY